MVEFLDLNLTLEIKCLECGHCEELKFRLGDYFNSEEDFLPEKEEQHTNYASCGLYIFCDLEKIYPARLMKRYYDGYKTFEKD